MGTEPQTDPNAYPPFSEVLATFRRLRARNMEMLDLLGESRLDEAPKQVPPGFEDFMRTVGQTYLLTALHTMGHIGQLAWPG
jgi:hypothetical protein